ncbi:MAG: 16S rRNA (cytidine(1402)-2'-O)-methyltransferase [Chloroflexota bacterium]|nr:16S rRNA (cytidine(1402)-2'-O)-methyltransferase [Chloroflexota bacterium]
MGTLFLVATPIGNLEDVTLRALNVLRAVSLVAAEDTRTARKLLSHYDIHARLVSYNEHNMRERTPRLMRALETGDVALVSEAGMPGVSDPGYELTVSALAAGHEVSPIPGASASVAAVAASGLPSRQFTFVGFLPRRSVERRRLFESLAGERRTLVAFESPHRLRRALEDIRAALGERRIAVCRELTKLHEEIFRGTLSEAIEHFAEPRGEFTLVVEGAPEPAAEATDEDLRAELRRLRILGASARDAAAEVARRTGVPRRRAYALSLEIEGPIVDSSPDAR